MSIYRGTYYAATGCDSSARPGTNALMSWYLGAYEARGAANLGTYTCKRLGSGWSIHAERRAADLGTAPYGGVDSEWGWNLANALRLNSAELGVQCIILGRKIWSCTYPDAGWRDYGGDWHGHMHVELTPQASQSLTAARIQELIGGRNPAPAKPDPKPAPAPRNWRKEIVRKMKLVDLSKVTSNPSTWVRGDAVGTLQTLLARRGFPPSNSFTTGRKPDNIGGPGTKDALGAFQRANKTGRPSNPAVADFQAGEASWSKMLGV